MKRGLACCTDLSMTGVLASGLDIYRAGWRMLAGEGDVWRTGWLGWRLLKSLGCPAIRQLRFQNDRTSRLF